MARQGRLHVPNATYFVVDRFRPGLEVLVPAPRRRHDSADLRRIEAYRRRFEALLDRACRRWCARVHAYCWLPDSALLLMQVSQVPLESILHSVRGSYSHFLRTRGHILRARGATGSPYAERYRALLIDAEAFFLDFVRHIFWSPVHAGLCGTPLAYPFSSARVCAGEPAPPFLYTRTLADALAARGFGSRMSFMRFLASNPAPGFLRLLPRGSPYDHRIAGGPLFVREIQQRSLAAPRAAHVDAIIAWVSRRLHIEVDRIVREVRSRDAVEARALVAWLATCAGSASLPTLAKRLSCSPTSLHRAIRNYLRIRPTLFNRDTLQEVVSLAEERDGEGPAAGNGEEPEAGNGEEPRAP